MKKKIIANMIREGEVGRVESMTASSIRVRLFVIDAGGRGEVACIAFSPAVQLISSNRVESVMGYG